MEHAPQAKTPDQIEYYAGAFFGSSLWLSWDGTQLWRFRDALGRPLEGLENWERLQAPSETAWAEMERRLGEVDAWHWRRRWSDPLILDGSEWSLALRWGHRSWKGSGDNASPPGFERLEALLERMARSRKIPGFPHAFRFHLREEQNAWDFQWNGRSLSWTVWNVVQGVCAKGECVTVPPARWKPLMARFSNARRGKGSANLMACEHFRFVSGPSDRPIVLEEYDSISGHWFKALTHLKDLAGLAPKKS